MVYILNKDGVPLMPTRRWRHIKKLLRTKQAKIVNAKPRNAQ